jgi:hypothetical protein
MNHDAATIGTFIRHSRQERILRYLSDRKRGPKFTDQLAHFRDLDAKYVICIPANE